MVVELINKYMTTLVPWALHHTASENPSSSSIFTRNQLLMASHRSTKVYLLFSVLLVGMATAHLSSTFHDKSCPKDLSTVKSTVLSAMRKEAI